MFSSVTICVTEYLKSKPGRTHDLTVFGMRTSCLVYDCKSSLGVRLPPNDGSVGNDRGPSPQSASIHGRVYTPNYCYFPTMETLQAKTGCAYLYVASSSDISTG